MSESVTVEQNDLFLESGAVRQEYPAALIDAHVHIYDCFHLNSFLDSALRNFQEAAQNLSVDNGHIGVLLLTETASDNKFCELKRISTRQKAADCSFRWHFCHTEEDCSLLAVNEDSQILVIVAGRQIVSQENLEILALGTTRSFPERRPIEDALAMIRESQALAVLPWGFGKWFFGRGQIIERLLNSAQHKDLFLGDNSGRPGFLPQPRFFAQARKQDIRILPGSDPLPFPRETEKPGSFGFILNHKISTITPASDIKRLLLKPEIAVNPYGHAETLLRFACNQVAMQVTKHKR